MFLTHHVNLETQVLVLSLNFVVADQSLVKLVLKKLDLVLILLHLSSGWADSLQVLALLSQIVKHLLVLIFQDHQTPIHISVRYLIKIYRNDDIPKG